MPMTRKTIADNTTRQKIVDDPDNPGNPLNVAPANVKRLQHELDKQLKIAEALIEGSDDEDSFTRGQAVGVQKTIKWLLDLAEAGPLDLELPHG